MPNPANMPQQRRPGMNVDVERVFEVQDAASGSFVLGTQDMVFELANTHDFRYRWNDLVLWHGPDKNNLEPLPATTSWWFRERACTIAIWRRP